MEWLQREWAQYSSTWWSQQRAWGGGGGARLVRGDWRCVHNKHAKHSLQASKHSPQINTQLLPLNPSYHSQPTCRVEETSHSTNLPPPRLEHHIDYSFTCRIEVPRCRQPPPTISCARCRVETVAAVVAQRRSPRVTARLIPIRHLRPPSRNRLESVTTQSRFSRRRRAVCSTLVVC